jgi:hypothetical protein
MSEMKILTTTEINADDCYCTGECSYLFTQGTTMNMEFVCSLYERTLDVRVFVSNITDGYSRVKRCYQCERAERALSSTKDIVTE